MEEREEGGTPNIVGCVRAGLAFMLKEKVDSMGQLKGLEGPCVNKEMSLTGVADSYRHRAISSWKTNPNIILLGNSNANNMFRFL